MWIGGKRVSATEFQWTGLIKDAVPENREIESDWAVSEPNSVNEDRMAMAWNGWVDIHNLMNCPALCEAP